jgi:hypothetical protein
MSAVPLIEAVQRAGGAIALQGDGLRLSAPEPLPQDLLEDLRLHKKELIDYLHHAGQLKLGEHAAAPQGRPMRRQTRRLRSGSTVWLACAGCPRLAIIRSMHGSS